MVRALMFAVAACLFSGCVVKARYRLDPGELRNLDGFDVRNERTMLVTVPTSQLTGNPSTSGNTTLQQLVTDKPYRLIHSGGRSFDFNSALEIAILTGDGATSLTRWRSMKVSDGALSAVPMKVGDPPLDLPLSSVRGAVVEVPSPGGSAIRTGLLITGLSAAVFGPATYAAYSGWNGQGLNILGTMLLSLGGGFIVGGAYLAIVGLGMDQNTDADANGILLGTLHRPVAAPKSPPVTSATEGSVVIPAPASEVPAASSTTPTPTPP